MDADERSAKSDARALAANLELQLAATHVSLAELRRRPVSEAVFDELALLEYREAWQAARRAALDLQAETGRRPGKPFVLLSGVIHEARAECAARGVELTCVEPQEAVPGWLDERNVAECLRCVLGTAIETGGHIVTTVKRLSRVLLFKVDYPSSSVEVLALDLARHAATRAGGTLFVVQEGMRTVVTLHLPQRRVHGAKARHYLFPTPGSLAS